MSGVLRSRLRGLVLRGRGGAFVSHPTSTYFSRINQCHALSSFLQVSQFGEYSTCKYNEPEEEAKGSGGSNSSRKVKKLKRPAWQPIIVGDIIDLHDHLFTKKRDYLVKYKDNQKVKAEHLAGKVMKLTKHNIRKSLSQLTKGMPLCEMGLSQKVIVLYFSLLGASTWPIDITRLGGIYSDLFPRNGFEIVFVAAKDVGYKQALPRHPRKEFEEMFSVMPWAAIPFSDIPSSTSLQKRGFPKLYRRPVLLIVDSTGMVLQSGHYGYNILERYGYSGYPFSDKRISKLKSEDDDSIAKPSLHTLMASPQRDYVISNKGEKVPIHTLENKVVALYFWSLLSHDKSGLEMAYEESRKTKKFFEIVLIYDGYGANKESFWELFKTMPWLALPYNDPNIKKLRRIFEHSSGNGADNVQVPGLVIFGPHGKFIDPCGAQIIGDFGIRAYPFTCAAVVKLEIEKTKDLRLEMLWDGSTVFTGKDGYEVPFSQLSGKRVIVIFETSEYCSFGEVEFLKMLKEMYLLWKGTCYEFEVIHIIDREVEPYFARKSVGDLPWLESSVNEMSITRDFFSFSSCWDSYFTSFVFFDRDGKLIRKRIRPLNSSKTLEFPFCNDGLEEAQAWRQLGNIIRRWWEYSMEHRIYSLDKMNVPASARDFGYLSED